MRLINVTTLQLEEFFGSDIPPYAILSHCWGKEEVSFQDFNGPGWRQQLGHQKITYACYEAFNSNLEYVWVDTCCIDKSSSAELSEAINSMYEWYKESVVCYAYLEDVNEVPTNTSVSSLSSSKWFTRGWTLQELLAPDDVVFFGSEWMFLGKKRELSHVISIITHIPKVILEDSSYLYSASIAKRMSWAARRQTTRVEDMAYCLLGIFRVSMPLLYGEGQKAFIRLQEEIIKDSSDQSIFIWQLHDVFVKPAFGGIFAESPANFLKWGNVVDIRDRAETSPSSMTSMGLYMELPVLVFQYNSTTKRYIAILDCHLELDFTGRLGISLEKTNNPAVFSRIQEVLPKVYSHEQVARGEIRKIYIKKVAVNAPLNWEGATEICCVRSGSVKSNGYSLHRISPSHNPFNPVTQTMAISSSSERNRDTLETTFKAAVEFVCDAEPSAHFIVGVTLKTLSASASIYQKPSGSTLEEWFEQFRNGSDLGGKRTGRVPLMGTGMGVLGTISVDVSQEKIFNRRLWILNVMCLS